jgi:hypothetical protein
MSEVKKLELIDQSISDISFSKYSNLCILNLSQNNLTFVNPDINNLLQLQYLDLSFNKIIELPDISNLKKLKSLQINRNMLTCLPSFSTLNKLEYLSAYGNKIKKIPDDIIHTNLEYLNVSDNELTELPNLEHFQDLVIYSSFNFIKIDKIAKLKNNAIQTIYHNNESIHDTKCQNDLKLSIIQLIDNVGVRAQDIDIFSAIDSEELFNIEFKDMLVENLNYVYSLYPISKHNVTIEQVLCCVWLIIQEHKDRENIIKIFYDVVSKSICAQSWIMNIVLSLESYVDYIKITLPDINAMAHKIFKIKTKLERASLYSIEKHKEKTIIKFTKMGIPHNIISEWVSCIE